MRVKVSMLIVVFIFSGCSTMATLSVGKDVDKAQCQIDDFIPRIYSGIFNDVRFIKNPPRSEFLFIITGISFSLALDTVVLPYTIPTQVVWGNICTPKHE